MCEARQLPNFVWFVNRAYLGGLSDRDDARLHVVLIPDPMIGRAHRLDRQLSVPGGKRNQLASGEFFRSAAFVDINMGGFGADNGMVGVGKRLQAKAIGCRAVKYKEDLDVLAEVTFEQLYRGSGVGVISIADDVALVHGGDRLDDSGMDARIVIAGKAASRLHGGQFSMAGVRRQSSGFKVWPDAESLTPDRKI